MPGAAAAAAAEYIPVKSRKSKVAGQDGGSSRPKASGEQTASASGTSTGSWTRCGGRTINEWMKTDKSDSRLDWTRAAGPNKDDERYLGKPCRGDHDTTHPLARHANQYKVSYKCVRCEMVMLYVPKYSASGKYRRQALVKTVGEINIEEITKVKQASRPSKKETETISSEDSFEKEGTSETEETPYVDSEKNRAAKELDLMRDSTKRPADLQGRRRMTKTLPQGGDPEGV